MTQPAMSQPEIPSVFSWLLPLILIGGGVIGFMLYKNWSQKRKKQTIDVTPSSLKQNGGLDFRKLSTFILVLGAIVAVYGLTKFSTKHNLKTGMEYTHSELEPLFGATVYVFSDQTVSVYKEVAKGEDICIRKKDGKIVTSDGSKAANLYYFNSLHSLGAPMGSTLSKSPQDDNPLEVIFGPGDRMPVLQSAPYNIKGTSVYVDWSQGHSQYFDLTRCDSGSEVFTIKNDGLVLESATHPGFNLTLGGRALSPMEQFDHDQRKKYEQEQKQARGN